MASIILGASLRFTLNSNTLLSLIFFWKIKAAQSGYWVLLDETVTPEIILQDNLSPVLIGIPGGRQHSHTIGGSVSVGLLDETVRSLDHILHNGQAVVLVVDVDRSSIHWGFRGQRNVWCHCSWKIKWKFKLKPLLSKRNCIFAWLKSWETLSLAQQNFWQQIHDSTWETLSLAQQNAWLKIWET